MPGMMSGYPIHLPKGHARCPTQDVQAQLRSQDINVGTVIIIRADGLPGDCLVFRANQGGFPSVVKDITTPPGRHRWPAWLKFEVSFSASQKIKTKVRRCNPVL